MQGLSPGKGAGRGGRVREGASGAGRTRAGAGRARGRGGSREGAGPGLPQLGRPRSGAHGAVRTARGLRTKGPRWRRGHRSARTPTLAQPQPGPIPGRDAPAEPKNVGRPALPVARAPASASVATGRLVRRAPGPVSCPGRRRRLAVLGEGVPGTGSERCSDLSKATQPPHWAGPGVLSPDSQGSDWEGGALTFRGNPRRYRESPELRLRGQLLLPTLPLWCDGGCRPGWRFRVVRGMEVRGARLGRETGGEPYRSVFLGRAWWRGGSVCLASTFFLKFDYRASAEEVN